MVNYATSRHLLPAELLLGCQCLAVGIGGGFGHGELHRALAQFNAADAWMGTLMVSGVAMIVLALASMCWRAPSDRIALNVARAHMVVAAFSFAAWLYSLMFALRVDGWVEFPVTTMLSAPALLFSCWAFVANTKVRVALDPAPESRGVQYDRRHA